MEINKSIAFKLWNDIFGENILWARDCFGTWIYKHDYNQQENKRIRPDGDGNRYNYGWNVDHIMPIVLGGKNHWNNFEPMHIYNNELKSGKINFKIDSISYQVVKCELSPGYGYGIKNQKTNSRIDWKYTQYRWYME